MKELYSVGILGSIDVHLARAWLRDLIRVGYIPPKLLQSEGKEPSRVKCESGVVRFEPQEMPTIFNRIGQKNVNVVKLVRDKSNSEL